jgi:hypothetical protein
MSPAGRAVYEQLLRQDREGLSDSDDPAALELIDGGYVVVVPGPPRQLVPVPPEIALGRSLMNQLTDWMRSAPDIGAVQRDIATLGALGHPLLRTETPLDDAPFHVFTTVEENALNSESMLMAARSEIKTMQPYPSWHPPEYVEDPATTSYAPDDMLGRGIRMQYLYDREILEIPWFRKSALEEVDHGAEARVAPGGLPTCMTIVDRNVATISCDPNSRLTLHTSAPLLVALLLGAFDLYWERSLPLRSEETETFDDPVLTQVLDLVVSGVKNDTIARQLGLSPRTVSRHISALYERYGVTRRTELVALATTRR